MEKDQDPIDKAEGEVEVAETDANFVDSILTPDDVKGIIGDLEGRNRNSRAIGSESDAPVKPRRFDLLSTCEPFTTADRDIIIKWIDDFRRCDRGARLITPAEKAEILEFVKDVAHEKPLTAEENAVISDFVANAEVGLQIHRDMHQSEVKEDKLMDMLDSHSEPSGGWNIWYNKRPGHTHQLARLLDPVKLIYNVGPVGPRILNYVKFCIDKNDPHINEKHLQPRKEFITLRPITEYVIAKSEEVVCEVPDETPYFLTYHVIQCTAYQFDQRSGHISLVAIIPESLAKRLDEAIRKNKKFRRTFFREAMQGIFPVLRGKEGSEYGMLAFNKDFLYIGPNTKIPEPPKIIDNLANNTSDTAAPSRLADDYHAQAMRRQRQWEDVRRDIVTIIMATAALAASLLTIKMCHDAISTPNEANEANEANE